MAELKERWENRLILNKLNIAEQYMRGNLCLVLEGKAGPAVRANNRECFPLAESNGASVEIREDASYFSPLAGQNQFIDIGGVDDGRQGGVLVRVVETANHIKEVASSAGENLKRHKESLDGRGWCFYSVTKSFITRSIASFGAVELWVLAAPIKPDHFPNNVIHGAPKVVDSIAYYQGKGRGRLAGGERDVQFPIIALMHRGIEVLPSKPRQLPFEIADVMIGPFDL